MQTELDEVSRKIMQLEIEEAALNKETDEISKQRLGDIQKEKAELKTKFDSMKAKWENEKNDISAVQKLREELEHISGEIEKAKREYDFNKAAELVDFYSTSHDVTLFQTKVIEQTCPVAALGYGIYFLVHITDGCVVIFP